MSKFAQTYGRFLDSGDVPVRQGIPARLLDAAAEPQRPAGYSYGEIDVAESYSYKPDVVTTHVHYVNTPNRVTALRATSRARPRVPHVHAGMDAADADLHLRQHHLLDHHMDTAGALLPALARSRPRRSTSRST